MGNPLPTIKEIARRLNVSVSTVSRALSDHPRIGLRTKMRVQQMARDLDYVPNAKAISFKSKKTYVVGVIVPRIREEFFSEAISGIETAAMEHEYTILFGQSFDDLDREKKVVEAMTRQRVDGLLISLSKQTNHYEHLQALEKYNIPVVYFDRVPPAEKVNKVFCNLFTGTVQMVDWLVKKGYKRIALINGPGKLQASKERLKGYMEGLSAKKLKVDMNLVETTDLSREGTVRAMENLLSIKQPPKAIITFNDYVHMDCVQYAQQKNIIINRDILFLSYANLPITAYTAHPPLASVEQYPRQQGERAMEMMIRLLNHAGDATPPFYREEIPGTLVIRENAGF